jgi:phosphonoacetate hydrolase
MKIKKRLLLAGLCITALLNAQQNKNLEQFRSEKRLVILMFDGFGMSYYKNAPMPNLQSMAEKGFYKQVKALMPTVTNANNASICTGTPPKQNGITGNSYLTANGKEEYMESKELLLAPTIFEKLKEQNIKSALISSKKKSIGLLPKGADIAVSPETADSSWTRLLGKAPLIYSPEANYWSMEAALYILKNQKDIRCLYLHTTDYPMHSWTPSDSNSLKHLATIDAYLGKIMEAAPDAMILITADHDVNHKEKCIDIENTLKAKGIPIKMAISAERDKYVKHHRGFGGVSYVYLSNPKDAKTVKAALLRLKGVELVLSREEAAKQFLLMPERIGDLVVMADSVTVFGNLDNKAEEVLPAEYRTHGSKYEQDVPLIIYNARQLPPASYFKYNWNLTGWLVK